MSEADVEAASEAVQAVGNDTRRFTQEESIGFYQGVSDDCLNMIDAIRRDIEEGRTDDGNDTEES